jgi:putative mRNA 3-end processing factor
VHINNAAPLLTFTPLGLYCPAADVYLDPIKPVKKALITHAHGDHARPGSERYLAHHTTVPLLHHRLGTHPSQVEGIEYGETKIINGVRFTFYPAGHVPGSAQILVENHGERWVFSGDYKVESDGLSTPLEPVLCHTFISECTFGLPIFSWRDQAEVFADIHSWWEANRHAGYASVILAYSLGKAQRILKNLDLTKSPVVIHPNISGINKALNLKLDLLDLTKEDNESNLRNTPPLVLAPPMVLGSSWLKRFGKARTAAASGWMTISGFKRRRGVDTGFVLSDHADFEGLNKVITATGARKILLTHGYTAQFGRWLSEKHSGLDVSELGAEFGGDEG